MLHEFITVNREEIIHRCRAKVKMRSVPPPTKAEIDDGWISEINSIGLVTGLRRNASAPDSRRNRFR